MFPLLPRNPHQIRRTWDKLLAVVAFSSLFALELLTFSGRAAESTPAIANFASSHQTIDNFSASDAWSMQHVGLWADANRKQVADLLFSTNNGIGLSAWRFNLMAGFDPTVSPGTLWQLWRSGNGFMTTPNRFDWDRQPGQRWFLAAAKGRGIDQFIAMVYSPPTNYTCNGKVYCTDGQGTSNLKPGYEVAFSQYMSDILVHFKTNAVESERVDINYIMPVNEPIWEWNGNSQEGSQYSNAGLIALAKALRNALDARGLKSEILLSETGDIPSLYSLRADISTKYKADYGNYISALNGITNVISRNLTAHSYWTDNPTNELVEVRQRLKAELSANPHWRYWQSEYCVMGPAGPGRDLTMKTALNVARVMWADLAIADAAAWHWWLSISQANYKDGLLYTDFWKTGDTETLYCSKNFWAFGQWSRFIRPGWKRIALPGYDDVFGLMGAAFTDPANTKIAMVFVNHASAGKVIKPSVSNLPGKRVTHWAPYITSAVASDNLSAMPPVAPETELLIPAESVVTLVGNITDGSSAVPVIAGLSDMSARAGETLSVKLSVTDSDTPAGLVQLAAYAGDSPVVGQSAISIQREYVTNALTRELFVDFSGEGLAKLAAAPRFPASPHARHSVPWFEAPQNVTGKHGTRLLGYVVPPQTGNYTFWIASRDASELYLSTDENPGKKRMIAWVNGYTAPREWTWEPNQQSTHVQLEAGKRYYVEAFQTAVAGGGHLSVGWQLPDQTMERPIPGSRLSPWIDPFTNSTQHTLTIKCPTNSSGTVSIAVVATDASGAASTNTINLTIAPAVSPETAKLSAEVEDGRVILTWPQDYIGCRLQMQTNSLSIGLGNQWTTLVGSERTNIWTNLIEPGIPLGFFRLSYQ